MCRTWNPVPCRWKCKMLRLLWKIVWRGLKTLNMESPPYDAAIPPLGIYWKRTESRDSTRFVNQWPERHTHNTLKTETTRMSVNEWLHKQSEAYPYKTTLFSLKEKDKLTTRCDVDQPLRHAEWSKPVPKGQVLYDSIHTYHLARLAQLVEYRTPNPRVIHIKRGIWSSKTSRGRE